MNHTHLKTAVVLVPVLLIGSLSALDGCSEDPASSSTSSSGGSTSGASSGSASGGSTSSGSTGGTSGASSGTSGASSGTSGDTDGGSEAGGDAGAAANMTFFVTSVGNGKGGDFRLNAGDTDGLAGADAFCKQLATAVSPVVGAKNWKAYLSTANVTARSRIGNGPFINSKGVTVAATVAILHDEGQMNGLTAATNLDERGNQVPLAGPNRHDILTGSQANGSSDANTCANWTSSATNVQGRVGHSNRQGGGQVPTSWNSAHATQGCAPTGANSVESGGGRGSIYCMVAQ